MRFSIIAAITTLAGMATALPHARPMQSTPMEKRQSGDIRVTFYNGEDLRLPSCGDWRLGHEWHPTGDHMIAALTTDGDGWTTSNGKPECKQFIRVTAPNGKSVVVRVVDSCTGLGCSVDGNKTVDLTEAAFKELGDLSEGVLENVSIEVIDKPGGKDFSEEDVAKYGPVNF